MKVIENIGIVLFDTLMLFTCYACSFIGAGIIILLPKIDWRKRDE